MRKSFDRKNIARLRLVIFRESRAAFAERIGCSERSVYNWEHGLTRPGTLMQRDLFTLWTTHAKAVMAALKESPDLRRQVEDVFAAETEAESAPV